MSTDIKINKFICLTILYILSVSVSLYGQDHNIRFEHISLEQGLSQVTVNCILQDRQGFMWFGTQDGLNKYDGYKFTVYHYDPENNASLSNNFIWSIQEDARGNLWIGTCSGGLNKFDPKTETFTSYQHQADNPQSLSNNFVWSVFEDSRGSLWIGTHGGGLNRFDRRTETFTRYMHQPDNPQGLSHNSVYSIFEDTGGSLWIGTLGGGLSKFDRKAEIFTRYQHQADNPQSLSSNFVQSIFEDTGGSLWIGTRGGLNKFDRKTETFIRYQHQANNPKSLSHNRVCSIVEDTGDNLWIGTYGGGLNKFDRKTETFSHSQHQTDNPQSLSSNFVQSIIKDAGGNLWIGTYGSGINKFDRMADIFPRYQHQVDNPQSLSNNVVWSIIEDSEGSLWIGTNGGGLNKFDRKTETFTRYQHQADNPQSLSNNVVWSIIEDSEGSLWVGTEDGLNKFDRKADIFTCYQHQANNPQSLSNNFVFSIFEDTGSNLWIGTYGGGLNKFDRKTETFTRYQHQADNPQSLSHNAVFSIFEDAGNNLWIGTNGGGLNKFDRKAEIFTRYRHQADNPQSISNNFVFSIFEDSKGNLWSGTRGGLNKFDRKAETFSYYRKKDGLPNDVVSGILEDDKGCLWLSTNNGISKFNPKTKMFTNYNKKDGLQSNEFNSGAYYKDRTGRMYFGGINGFNEFYPDSVKDNTYIPPVVITDFLLFNKPVEVAKTGIKSDKFQLQQHIGFTKEITLDYTDYIFAFEFSALNYRQSEKNKFAYKLEGLDKDWMETDYLHRRATYTNLPHGEYIFRVKASNDDGVWNEQGASIKINILPPFWKTWWFRTLAALLIMILAYTIYKLRIRSITAQREMLRVQVNERTKELNERTKELKKRNSELSEAKKETDNILQNVEEGFFLLNSVFEIGSQYSSSLIILLEDKDLGYKNFIKMLKHNIPAKTISSIEEYLELMFNDDIDEETLKELNPLNKIELNFKNSDDRWVASKHLSFKFKRITNYKNKTTGLIVTVTDITDQIHLAKQLKESEAHTKRQIEWLVNILHVEPELLREFMEGGRKELNYIEDLLKQDKTETDYITSLENIYRSMHLIKSNASLLDLKFFVKKTHDFEDEIAKIKEKTKIEGSDFVPLVLQLNEMQKTLDELNDLIERISNIHTQFRPKRSYENKLFIQSIQNLIENLAKDMGKEIKFIHNKFDAGVVPYHYRLLSKEILIQLARNSVFHGIESADERIKLNKEPYGTIEISSFIKNNKFGFTFRDDGRGLQIEKLRKKAKEFGKWDNAEIDRWDDKQTADIIFTQGISTSEKAELAAGRGVGMDIIKQKLGKNNGQIKMSFSKGKFCKFEISLPVKKKNTKDKTKKVRVADI